MKKVGWILSILALFASGFSGLNETAGSTSDVPTTGLQQLVWFSVALYGVLGVLGGVGLLRRRPWCVTVSVAWAVAVICAASVASFAFHDPQLQQTGTLTGVIGAFASTAVVGALVVWAARVATRPAPVPVPVPVPDATPT